MVGKQNDRRASDDGFVERIAEVARFCRVNPDDPDRALAAILDAALELTNADRGNIQLLEPSGALVIASQRGFDEESLSFFARVDAETSACGQVVRTGEQHIVEDITNHDAYSGTEGLSVMLRAGVRAIQSTPLVSSAGTVVGIVSTTFRQPHRPTKAELAAVAVLAGIAADHLEHANARRRARWGSQTLEALLGILPIPAYLALDPECRIVRPNAAAAAIFGTPTNENASQAATEAGEAPSFRMYRGGKRLAAKDMPLERAVATGETQRDASLDVELPNGDRRSITGTAAPLFDDDGEVRGAVGVFIDITALRKAEEAREQSAARLRLALRAAHAAIWQSDPVSGPVFGPEVNEIFGYPADRVLTVDDLRSRYLPGELDRFRRVAFADLALRERTDVEVRIRRLDGEVRWLLLRGELTPSAGGRPNGFVGVVNGHNREKRSRGANQVPGARDRPPG